MGSIQTRMNNFLLQKRRYFKQHWDSNKIGPHGQIIKNRHFSKYLDNVINFRVNFPFRQSKCIRFCRLRYNVYQKAEKQQDYF